MDQGISQHKEEAGKSQWEKWLTVDNSWYLWHERGSDGFDDGIFGGLPVCICPCVLQEQVNTVNDSIYTTRYRALGGKICVKL